MKIRFAILATGAALAATAAWGQTGLGNWMEFNNSNLSGEPFSATAKSRLVHTLEDGTHIDQTTTTVMYRDAQGRTRNDTDGRIRIVDPTAHHDIVLDPEARTATQRSADGYVPAIKDLNPYLVVPAPAVSNGEPSKHVKQTSSPKVITGTKKRSPNVRTLEDLGVQTVDGVLAHGVRTTLTIPAGTIGNDREIKVVNENWTSEDLRMLIKSVNSDPRFGTSTYELTNIVQAAPSAELFQIPAGYTVRKEYGGIGVIGGGVLGHPVNPKEY